MSPSDISKNAAHPPTTAVEPASILSDATTLTSVSLPLQPDKKQLNTLPTHNKNTATATTSSTWTSSATTQETPISSAQRKVLQLKRDMDKAGAELPEYSTRGLFKEAYSTDLLFLIDATHSMRPYIDAAKDQVKTIISDIRAAFFNAADVRIAVVSYRDHSSKVNIEWLDFTTDIDAIYSFLDRLKTRGGSDWPEDVCGGIDRALNAIWKSPTRCIIHIADAPPHGTRYHDLDSKSDDWPEAGSEPHGLTLEPLLEQMIKLNINYALLRITGYTDRMASVVYEKYAAVSAGCKIHAKNIYSSKCPERVANPKQGVSSALLFEEQELGTEFVALQHLVVNSVTQSVSRSFLRSVSSATKTTKFETTQKLDTSLVAISEENSNDSPIETKKPQWNKRGWLDETFIAEGFTPDLSFRTTSTLNDMLEHEDNIKIDAVELSIHKRSRPFSQGAARLAFYAQAQTTTDPFVVKSYKKGSKPFAHFAKDMQCQALCKAYALEFNSLLGSEVVLDFVVTMCLKGKQRALTFESSDQDEQCLSLEPFLEGAYIKYNNNCGYVNPNLPPNDFLNKATQAFSHFTYERSRGAFLVCDLQGVGNLLTDPAIHTLDPYRFRLGDTNLGRDGFRFFFATHVCNDVCHRLGLKSNTEDMKRGIYLYRADWPAVDMPLGANKFRCCSNKLCGKITRLPPGFDPTRPQRYHWCHTCYQQMRSSVERLVCTAVPKPRHDFTVSRFLCESQGLPMPRACAEHRGMEVEMLEKRRSTGGGGGGGDSLKSPSVDTDGSKSFWSRMMSGGKKSSK